jgi:tetratricopeptide (TPR) repeat protein
MSKNRFFDVLLGAAVVGTVGYFVYQKYAPPKIVKKPRVGITKANDILKYKTVIPDKILNTTATSSACTLFLKSSAEMSMNDYANQFVDHKVDAILKTCSGAFPGALQSKLDDAIAKCQSSAREKISNECYGALMMAKTASVATVVRPDVDPKELDATILLHLIADKFSNGDFFEHPNKSLAIVNALLDKEPSYLGGYKVKLLLLSMSSLNKDDRTKDDFQDTLDQAKRLNPNDPEVREISLAERGEIFKNDENSTEKKDRTEFINYLDQESSKHPTEWIYDYYKANAVYDNGKGNYDQAVTLLENALKKAPGDRRIQQTLDNLKSDDENRKKHPFTIAIGFTLNDL